MGTIYRKEHLTFCQSAILGSRVLPATPHPSFLREAGHLIRVLHPCTLNPLSGAAVSPRGRRCDVHHFVRDTTLLIPYFRVSRILKSRGLPDFLFNVYPLLESLPEMWPFIFDPRLLHLRVLLGGLGNPRQLEGIPAQGTVLGKEAGLACWRRGRRLLGPPNRRASQQLRPRPRPRP